MKERADGMLGAVMASESLGLTDTMINGAGGCRSRTQIMLHDLIPSYYPENRACCRSKYFSRQSRLPCTYLNNDDIVFGSAAKVSEGIESIASTTGKRAVLLDTLGASLICTDYSGLTGTEGHDPIFIDGDLSGMEMCEGYDLVMRSILSSLDLEGDRNSSVNILGYGIMDLGWEYGADQLASLLESMGIRVNCIPGCMSDRESVMSIGKASLNILIHPEYSVRTAEMLSSRFGTPYLRLTEGAPIGYPAVRSFVREVAEAMEVDPQPALDIIDREAGSVHRVLMNFDRQCTSLYAKGMVLKGDSSVVYPIMKWMMGTFGMVPRSVTLMDDAYLPEIRQCLSEHGLEDALNGLDGDVEVVFSDGLESLEGRLSVTTSSYVEIGLPRGRMMDLMGRTLIGPKGCRYILDEMMNGRIRFRCGQPTEVDYRPGGQEE